MFIKIKQFPKLYLFKLRIRILKNFVKTILYLSVIRTPQKLIKMPNHTRNDKFEAL